MGNLDNYYEILGIKKDAKEAEVKSAYRKLVKQYHPDANPDNTEAEEKIKEINEAFAVLSDAQKRAEYDKQGHFAYQQDKSSGPIFGGFGGGDINFANYFGGTFGDIFGEGRSKSDPKRGRDTTVSIHILANEAALGVDKEVSFDFAEICTSCSGNGLKPGTKADICPHCHGSGQERVITQNAFGKMTQTRECPACRGRGKSASETCPKCFGKGSMKMRKKIMVKIPKGIKNEQAISIKGMGEPGKQGGERGNLLIKVFIRPKHGYY
ncbi:MAG: DnaJ domain-containing protein [Firmicutes bacterium]|nr:DnaJ domain-containing protein [Bacillota bacterium]